MDIIDYTSSGGKNLIDEYLDSLPKKEMIRGYKIKKAIKRAKEFGLQVD